jgi:hypothetical protein
MPPVAEFLSISVPPAPKPRARRRRQKLPDRGREARIAMYALRVAFGQPLFPTRRRDRT